MDLLKDLWTKIRGDEFEDDDDDEEDNSAQAEQEIANWQWQKASTNPFCIHSFKVIKRCAFTGENDLEGFIVIHATKSQLPSGKIISEEKKYGFKYEEEAHKAVAEKMEEIKRKAEIIKERQRVIDEAPTVVWNPEGTCS